MPVTVKGTGSAPSGGRSVEPGGPETVTMAQCDPSIQDCSVMLDPLTQSLVLAPGPFTATPSRHSTAEPAAGPMMPPPFSFAEPSNGGSVNGGTSPATYIFAGLAVGFAAWTAWYLWRR